jgi:GNAT superfamily N-acetyltransferase
MVRAATEADLGVVLRLAEQWDADGETVGYAAPERSVLMSHLCGCFFVAELNGEIVGYAYGTSQKNDDGRISAVVPLGAAYVEIEDLYVRPRSRSNGIGGQLVDEVARWARTHGFCHMTLFSSTMDIERILRFYRSQGFFAWGVQMYRNLGDSI